MDIDIHVAIRGLSSRVLLQLRMYDIGLRSIYTDIVPARSYEALQ